MGRQCITKLSWSAQFVCFLCAVLQSWHPKRTLQFSSAFIGVWSCGSLRCSRAHSHACSHPFHRRYPLLSQWGLGWNWLVISFTFWESLIRCSWPNVIVCVKYLWDFPSLDLDSFYYPALGQVCKPSAANPGWLRALLCWDYLWAWNAQFLGLTGLLGPPQIVLLFRCAKKFDITRN